nr:MAG TPA: hypothetical protein [Caudoviricetes sp.]
MTIRSCLFMTKLTLLIIHWSRMTCSTKKFGIR